MELRPNLYVGAVWPPKAESHVFTPLRCVSGMSLTVPAKIFFIRYV